MSHGMFAITSLTVQDRMPMTSLLELGHLERVSRATRGLLLSDYYPTFGYSVSLSCLPLFLSPL